MAEEAERIKELWLWDDEIPRDGPEQMACDEALLETGNAPILRIFRWKGPWVSAGYFADKDHAVRTHPEMPFCRRWTGGGIVVHDGDFTYSLVVPKGETLAALKPRRSYQVIHSALGRALRARCIGTDLAEKSAPAAECFAGAVEHDLVNHGKKLAGGAQRRTRHGLLHQGSVQCQPLLDRSFGITLAGELALAVARWRPPADFEKKVRNLLAGKYASPRFLQGPGAAEDFTAPARS
ncbi:MAG: lipoyl protein ligase domain-containing protein [Chthoniobacterales bacterium]